MFDVGQLVIVSLIASVGGFIQRVTGFGFGIFVMIFFPYIIKNHTSAAAISTLISCVVSLYNAIMYRKVIPYKKIIPLIVAAIVTIPISVKFSVLVSEYIFKKILGIVLIMLSIYFLVFSSRIKIKPTFKNGLLAGGLGGVLTGLFSTGGPPVVLYLMNAFNNTSLYFASTQFYFGLTGVYSTVVRALNGIITIDVLVFSLIGFLGSLIGNFFGKLVFDKLNTQKLKQLVYSGMIISGIIMIFG